MKVIGIAFAIFIIFSNSPIYAKDTQPKGLKAVASDNVVYLNWHKSKKDVKGYWIYKAVPEGNYQRVNFIPLKENFYEDTGVVNGQLYWYTITAIDKDGNESSQSKDVMVTPNVHEEPLSGY